MTSNLIARLSDPKIRVMIAVVAILFATIHFFSYFPTTRGITFTGPARWSTSPTVFPPDTPGSRTSPGAGLGKLSIDPQGKLTDLSSGFVLTDFTVGYESAEGDIGKQVQLIYLIERPFRYTRGSYANAIGASGWMHVDSILKASGSSVLINRWGNGGESIRGTSVSIGIPTLPANRQNTPKYFIEEQSEKIQAKAEKGGTTNLQQLFSVVLSPTAPGQHFVFHFDSVR